MLQRSAGILIPLFSLRSRADLGRGEIGGLIPMLEWARRMGHRMIQLLPIDETAPDEASPYSAMSVFAIDPTYITLEGLAGVSESSLERARRNLAVASSRVEIRQIKLELLHNAYRRFRRSSDAAGRTAFADFERRNDYWLADYALFRALKEEFGWSSWEQWPTPLRDREPDALDQAQHRLAAEIAMYRYWQFVADAQMRRAHAAFTEASARLVGDLAFSPGLDSAEVWAHRDQFDLTRLVGAPPDAFSVTGQRWGLPMPNWDRMRSTGWSLIRSRLRRASELYDLVRIDHVVGLYRTWNFGLDLNEPGRFTPEEESKQRAQGEEIIRALQDEGGTAGLIAEDLGVIPPWVRDSLRSLGVPGYKIMRWEREGQGHPGDRFIAPAHYPELSLATTSTHDTETMAEWWREIGAQERRVLLDSLGIADRADAENDQLCEPARNAILEAIYAAPSCFVVEPIQDLFGWTARINSPGTVADANWTWRLPAPIEELMNDPEIARQTAALAEIVKRSGRS
jgi:4-alpha-glucanotransferase